MGIDLQDPSSFIKLIKMKNLLLLFFSFYFASSGFSQAPEAFNYQGVARDLSGAPISDAELGVRISVLKGSPSGSSQYLEEHVVTTNDLGLFTLQVGNGTSESSLGDVDWASGVFYLQIEIDLQGDGGYQIMGASQLSSVPFALYANNGGQWTRNEEDLYYSKGEVGIGTAPVEGILQVAGDDPSSSLSVGVKRVQAADGVGAYGHHLASSRDLVINIDANGNEGERAFSVRLQTSGSDVIQRGESLFIADKSGNMGLGNFEPVTGPVENPAARLHLRSGDIFLEERSSGIIMKSEDGQCWRMKVSNLGMPEFASVSCPR